MQRGNELIYKFYDENKIWYKNCGKIVVSKEQKVTILTHLLNHL